MGQAEEAIRKIFKVGNSLVFAIPPEYIEAKDLQVGDKMRIFMDEYIHAKPMKREEGELKTKLEKAKVELDK